MGRVLGIERIMRNEIFIHDSSSLLYRADHVIDPLSLENSNSLDLSPLTINEQIVGYLIDLEFDEDKEKMPSRKAQKLMRKDSVAAFMSAKEIVDRQELTTTEKENLVFFVINGNCLDQVQEEIALVAGAYLENTENEASKRNTSLQTIMPPLFALKVLTNGTQSVIAQELEIKGNNTTFGNTSHAFFDALKTYEELLNTSLNRALISCSTGAGLYTLFNHLNSFESEKPILSLCGSSLLVGPEKVGAFAKISELDNKKEPPKMSGAIEISDFSWVSLQNRANTVLYCGVPSTEFNQKKVEQLTKANIWNRVINLSRVYGSLGASSINIGIISALEIFKKEPHCQSVDIINTDPYGRESLIKVERCHD